MGNDGGSNLHSTACRDKSPLRRVYFKNQVIYLVFNGGDETAAGDFYWRNSYFIIQERTSAHLHGKMTKLCYCTETKYFTFAVIASISSNLIFKSLKIMKIVQRRRCVIILCVARIILYKYLLFKNQKAELKVL